uniref:Uncharacterized protein n=1 Tax=Oryza brachyantha TaxID=4533 RepID=J3KYC9_ORYBR
GWSSDASGSGPGATGLPSQCIRFHHGKGVNEKAAFKGKPIKSLHFSVHRTLHNLARACMKKREERKDVN